MKIGLALGGGGARGFAHLGVVKALHELNVPIYCIAGTSMGAIIGGIVAAGREEQAHKWVSIPDWKKLPRLFFEIGLPWRGLLRGRRIEAFLRDMIPSTTFRDLKIPFATVAADCKTGEEVVISTGNVVSAIRASMAVPGVFHPVEIGGRILIDGGLVNPVPVDVCRSLGAEAVIAVDITPDSSELTYDAKSISVFDTVEATLRICATQLTRAKERISPADLMLQPRLRDVMFFDFRSAHELVVQGYEYAMRRRRDILDLVEQPAEEGALCRFVS